jgi:hypothetical protein
MNRRLCADISRSADVPSVGMPQAEVMFTRRDRAVPAFCRAGTPEKETLCLLIATNWKLETT